MKVLRKIGKKGKCQKKLENLKLLKMWGKFRESIGKNVFNFIKSSKIVETFLWKPNARKTIIILGFFKSQFSIILPTPISESTTVSLLSDVNKCVSLWCEIFYHLPWVAVLIPRETTYLGQVKSVNQLLVKQSC